MLSENSRPVNDNEVELEETSPSVDWKLPKISAKQVYDSFWAFRFCAFTNVHISEHVLTTTLTVNKMKPLTILSESKIRQAREKGFKFAHLGLVKIGLNALHRQGVKTYAFCCLLDQRWKTFPSALIGGIQTPLSEGPVSFDVYPNFSISLEDPHALKSLTLGIQTRGYEIFETKSKNLSVFYSTCVRYYNTTIPAVLHQESGKAGYVTMVQYDSNSTPMRPKKISRGDLRPPKQWFTQWETARQKVSMDTDYEIQETPDGVITRFKSLSEVPQVSRGELSHHSSSSLSKSVFENEKDKKIVASTSFPIHETIVQVPYCAHPGCQNAECKWKDNDTFEINAISVRSYRHFKPKKDTHGLGWFAVPQKRKIANSNLPVDKQLSEEEMMIVCSHLHGLEGFDKKDSFNQKLYLWDIQTHPLASQYDSEYDAEARKKNGKLWIEYMIAHNKWVSLLEWFYGFIPESEDVEHVEYMDCKYEYFLRKPDKRKFKETFLVEVNMMDEDMPESSEPSAKKTFKWTTSGGQTIETNSDVPPWQDLYVSKDNTQYHLRPLQADSKELDVRNIVASLNWTNLAIHKHHRSTDSKISQIGRDQRDLLKKYVVNMDTNIVSLAKKVDVSNDLLIKEVQSVEKKTGNAIKVVNDDLTSIENELSFLKDSIKELKLESESVATTLNYWSQRKKLSAEQKEKRSKEIELYKKKPLPPFSLFSQSVKEDTSSPLPFSSGIDIVSTEVSVPNWLVPFRLPSAESTKETLFSSCSKDLSEKEDPFMHKLDIEEVHANISEYGKWKVAPDLNQESNLYPQKEWSANNIVSWSIENRTPNEVVTVLENMITCYKTYLSAGTSPVDAVNNLIIGFEGRLRHWLLVRQNQNPNLISEWANTVVLNSLGQPQILSDGSTENNFIGKLIEEIEKYFVGPRSNVKAAEVLALNQMKLDNMVNFHAHYEEYMRRLHQIDDCLSESWKLHFVSTLPKWFAQRLMDVMNDSKKQHTWGGIYQLVQTLILHLCRDQKQIKKVASANQKYLIDPLCKQFHVFSGQPAVRKNRGAGYYTKKKKHRHKELDERNYHPKMFRKKKKPHKQRMQIDQ